MKRILFLITVLLITIQLKSQVLNVNEFIQEKSQWCWAAVSACVLDYYCVPISQCAIAEYTRTVATWHDFGDHNCCGDSAQDCNYWNYNWYYKGSIEDILTHHANIFSVGTGILSEDEIRNDIQANRLFIARWEWNNGNGHFLVGHGLVNDNIFYMDPLYGEGLKLAKYSWFLKSTRHKWTDTNRILDTPEFSVAGPADSISGPGIVCKGQDTIIYSTPEIENASAYVWTLPPGASGTISGNSIVVSYSDTATSGNITVKGMNDCGEGMVSVMSVEVCETPDSAGIISGMESACAGEDSVVYIVPAIHNATEYVWTLPEGATGSSDTNSIVVFYGDSALSGEITVKGTNVCEEGAAAKLAVTVISIPPKPVIELQENVLRSSASSGNQWYDQDGPIEGANDQEYIAVISGQYFVQVNHSGCISPPSDISTVSIAGTRHIESESAIHVFPNPFSNELILENKGMYKEVSFDIVNAQGQVVFKGNLFDVVSVNTHTFLPGLYLIRLDNGNELEFRKLINE